MQEMIWITADKQHIPVSMLADSHLHNIIAKIHRDRTWRTEFLPRLLLEVQIRSMGLHSQRRVT